jgi:hypothetical protein
LGAETSRLPYTRRCTATPLATLNVVSGQMLAGCMPRHRHEEFVRFLERIERSAPLRMAIHLILDKTTRHLHTCGIGGMVCGAFQLSRTLHAHRRFLAEHGGTIFRPDD